MTLFFSRFAVAVLFGLGLAGCSAVGSTSDEARAPGGMFNPGNYVYSRESHSVTRGARPVAALPAAAGRVIDVREKRFGNGFTQEIALAADSGVRGENVILVVIRDQPNAPSGEPEVEMPKDRQDEIAIEIDKRFPGGNLGFVDTVLRNGYGPYGLASGRIGAANCVFFWQSLNDLKPFIRSARVSPYKIETSVRVRLCRSGASLAQLARLASEVIVDTGGVSSGPAFATTSQGVGLGADPLADAIGERRAAGGERFAGYIAPSPTTFAEEEARPRRVVRYAAAPRRRHVVRYARTRRVYARRQEAAAPQAADAQPYAQAPVAYTAGYAQPGQVIWTQPGAAAVVQTAAPAYGGAVSAQGSVGLPAQAYGGPSSQGWVAVPR